MDCKNPPNWSRSICKYDWISPSSCGHGPMHHMFINCTHYTTHTQIGLATPLPNLEGMMDEMGSKSATGQEVVEGNSTTTSQEVCIPPKKVYTALSFVHLAGI